MEIRPARADDLDRLAEVEDAADALFVARFGPDPAWDAAVDGRARAVRRGFLLVAAEGAAVLGFAHVLDSGADAHLEQLAVRPEAARRGVGSALLEAAVEVAAERDLAWMTLRTFRDVPWNAPFYARRGFRVVEPAPDVLHGFEREERAAGLDRFGPRVLMARALERPGVDGPGTVRSVAEVLMVARRAMGEILTAEELATAEADVVQPGPVRAAPSETRVLAADERIGAGPRQLRATVLGESAHLWLATERVEDDAELFARIRSDLQDFVAESSFGWGQLRP